MLGGQVALPGADPERPDDLELGGRLDPLGDHEGAPPIGQVAQRADHLERLVVARSALDERQVDLHDVEAQLAEKPQPGIAGPDVIARQPAAGQAEITHGAPKPGDFLARLPRRISNLKIKCPGTQLLRKRCFVLERHAHKVGSYTPVLLSSDSYAFIHPRGPIQ